MVHSLFFVTVDGQRGPSVLTEVLSNIVSDTLSADENEDFGILLLNLLKVLDKLGALLKVAADFDDLLNVVVGGEFERTDVDLNEVAQKVLEKECIVRLRRGVRVVYPEHTLASFWTSLGQVALNMRV